MNEADQNDHFLDTAMVIDIYRWWILTSTDIIRPVDILRHRNLCKNWVTAGGLIIDIILKFGYGIVDEPNNISKNWNVEIATFIIKWVKIRVLKSGYMK